LPDSSPLFPYTTLFRSTFSTSHEKYRDAGLILNNKIVVVDFDDNAHVGEAIFRLFPTLKVYSKRGFHLYYRRPKGLIIKNWTKKDRKSTRLNSSHVKIS